jgi:hypothetical protein
MSIVNGNRHGGKGDEIGVPPEWWKGCGGRTLPLSPNPWEGMMRSRMKTERRGVTPPPHSLLPKYLPLLGDIFNPPAGIFGGVRR